ncbi:hypothetical protein SERLA73DRAFT_187813 [Serpula lacrymans var. lacrymans S7.3]|uniref:Uncharacterized protein n=1 Tax=Serpula lacrymans var. lacrymans (strain S7.3) TaxID=936435 RepID=F8QAG8_SERL3|nr:hypothetical protein SERLA73DRAFT_187813 [Serpula lacrymans var. lacrymans S7.3]
MQDLNTRLYIGLSTEASPSPPLKFSQPETPVINLEHVHQKSCHLCCVEEQSVPLCR